MIESPWNQNLGQLPNQFDTNKPDQNKSKHNKKSVTLCNNNWQGPIYMV